MQEANVALLFLRPLNRLGIDYMVTGSVAAIVYGEPRLTHDLDLVIDLNAFQIAQIIETFSSEDFYCPSRDVILFESDREQRGHINLLHVPTGFKADFFFRGRDPLHIWALERTRSLLFFGETVRIAPPEYVIVRKLEFFREGGSEKHLRDIRLMLKISGKHVNQQDLSRLLAERGLEHYWSKLKQEP